ncbi:hypothetical protein PMZ80_009471 [Knufia obscura]|uniref:N-acetyltransferase domain-containing protein n=2 Tax=Knufia TaxID=430999 RepID=A0AAN8ELR1_9EURO|nr:hypothetical protein PMZ80_009471 [Knufia obscura]KAK5949591.1 hypothetical protein OHC33_009398 [Knufia fluminis]
MSIRIISRTPRHLNALVQLFHSTVQANGCSVKGPPVQDLPESWLAFFAGADPSMEVFGLVVCQGGSYSASVGDGNDDGNVDALLVDVLGDRHDNRNSPCGDANRSLGHASLRRISHDSRISMPWHASIHGKTIKDGEIWEVCRLAVHPSAQGKGIGTKLMKTIEVEAQTEGKTLVLGVLEIDELPSEHMKGKTGSGLGKTQ